MLQRQQTLWLLLSVLCAILSFRFPFVTGKEMIKGLPTDAVLNAGSNFFLLVLTGAAVVVAGITLYMFRDRKIQLKLCLAGVALSILIIIIYIAQMGKLQKPTLALSCILALAIAGGFVMAFRGIRHDEKLVKTLDKLR